MIAESLGRFDSEDWWRQLDRGEQPGAVGSRPIRSFNMGANSDLVRGAYAAFGRGDIPAVLAILDPQVEWIETDARGIPTRGTHHGPEAVALKVFAPVPENFESFALVPETFIESGETLVVTGRVRARTKAGHDMDAPYAHVFTIRDGKIVRNENHHDTALWLEALEA